MKAKRACLFSLFRREISQWRSFSSGYGPSLLETQVYFHFGENEKLKGRNPPPGELTSPHLSSLSLSLYVSSTCRDHRNILARHGPRGQGAVPGGGAGEGHAGPQRRLLRLHHGHSQPDWCQRQWAHIPAPWVTHPAWVTVMQTPGHAHWGGINERVQSAADCEEMFDIIPTRYLFDHSSPVSGGWVFFLFFVFFSVPPAPQSAVHISLFRRQPKLKRRQSRKEWERETEKEKEWRRRGCSVHQRVHTYMCRPLDEFNHSHMRGHLSWPLETNLALPSDKPPAKWMPREEINSVENETARMILLTINITFAFIAGATASHGLHVQSKGALLILYGHTSLWTVPCVLSHNCKLLSAGIYLKKKKKSLPDEQLFAVEFLARCGIHPNGVPQKTQSHFLIFLLESGRDYVELPQFICDSHKLTLRRNVLITSKLSWLALNDSLTSFCGGDVAVKELFLFISCLSLNESCHSVSFRFGCFFQRPTSQAIRCRH